MVIYVHHPISITLTFPDKIPLWRLHPAILPNKTWAAEIRKCLLDYFGENNTSDASKLTQWEAHKYVVRGKLLSLVAAIKREKQAILKDIFTKLKTLEATQKSTLAQQFYQELTEVCTLLQE